MRIDQSSEIAPTSIDTVTIRAKLDLITKIMWILVCLGFGAGVWATTIQLRLEEFEKWRVEQGKPIEKFYDQMRETSALNAQIFEKLNSMERRIDELTSELKELRKR